MLFENKPIKKVEQLILNIKDKSKLSFLLQLIKQFDFVEVVKIKEKKASKNYNFFNSAGLWINRTVDAKELRKEAWNRKK